jgi:hypothetical protein
MTDEDFYEPWIPEGRVRYRYRPECPGVYGMLAPVGHPREFDGETGTVYEVCRSDRAAWRNGHRYLVRLDNGRCVQSAALELEPEDHR